MGRITLYHNPQCSKSRAALALLEQRGADLEVVEYLKTPPDAKTLRALLAALPDEPAACFRRDAHWKSLGRDEVDYATEAQVVALLLEHPRLLQRPIAVRDDQAVVGRPPEDVLRLLD